MLKDLSSHGVRAEMDISSEKLNYKIRKAIANKIPYIIIIGEKEQETQTLSIRRKKEQLGSMTVTDFLKLI